jgi:predicted DNA-binding mobile mystery protein A
MRDNFRNLLLNQLARSLSSFEAAQLEARPQRGWLRAIREGLSMSLEEVGRALGQSKKRILDFEHAEAEDRITLKSLRRVASAMECELVYALVPKSGSIAELAEKHRQRREHSLEQQTRDRVKQDVLGVEHTMALENQATGGVDRLIEEETKRRLKKK